MSLRTFTSGWAYVSALLWLAIGTAVLQLWPASYWFDVRRVYVSDPVLLGNAEMAVTREIKREFFARWHVTIKQWDGGWVSWCSANGAGNYTKQSKLPKHLDVAWWTTGQCPKMPLGKYYITTVWNIEIPGLMPDKRIVVDSNVFDVR